MRLRGRKTAYGKLCRAALFVVILGLLLGTASRILVRKASKKRLGMFLDSTVDYDVLFTGISHTEVGVYPLDLYEDYGIASYNLGESGCSLPYAYWVLQMALRHTTPKLVVVDVRRMDIEETGLLDSVMNDVDAFPLSLTKIRAAFDLYESFEDRVSFLSPLYLYHGRWAELTKTDFHMSGYRYNMGARHYSGSKLRVIKPKTLYEEVPEEEQLEGSEMARTYLRKIITLCQARGIDVLLQELPFPATEEEQRYANGVQAIADEYGVPYLNFHHIPDIIDFHTDLSNADHVNDSGARKITYALGEYLSREYELPDRREDPAYAFWESKFAKYMKYKENRISTRDDSAVVLMLLMDRHMKVELKMRENSPYYKDERILRLVKNICAEGTLTRLEEAVETGAAYEAYIDNSSGTIEETLSEDPGTADLEVTVYNTVTGEPFTTKTFTRT